MLAAGDVYEVDVDGCLKDCDSTYGIIDDKKFKVKMTDIEMRDVKKIKRFLFGVNCDVQADGDLMRESRCTVEHILPRASRHWTGWGGFDGDNPEDWVHRMGNLTLLGRHDNKPGDAQNRDLAAKRERLFEQRCSTSRERSRRAKSGDPRTSSGGKGDWRGGLQEVWSFERSIAG